MPIEAKDGLELLSGSGVVGGIVTAVTAFGWWLRKERTESAKTKSEVAASNASSTASDSQASQIAALTKRANEQGEGLIMLMNEIFTLKNRVAHLEAGRVGANTLLPAIHLCESCDGKYGKILVEISRLLQDEHDITAPVNPE